MTIWVKTLHRQPTLWQKVIDRHTVTRTHNKVKKVKHLSVNKKRLFTSSGNMRVKSYSVTIVTPVWCLVGRLFTISFMVSLPFSVGGGCRMRAGELGGKPSESIWEKLTAACWQAHVKMTMVSRWVNCSMLVRDDGMPWSVSPSRRA